MHRWHVDTCVWCFPSPGRFGQILALALQLAVQNNCSYHSLLENSLSVEGVVPVSIDATLTAVLSVSRSEISASSLSLFVPMCQTRQPVSPDRQQTSGTARDLNNLNITRSVRTFVLVSPPSFAGLAGKMTA